MATGTIISLTPKNIGVLRKSIKMVQITIAANSSYEYPFYSYGINLDDYSLIIMGGNSFANSYREGYVGAQNVMIPTYLAKKCLNQYGSINSPDDSWQAWFIDGNTLHVENRTSNSLTFRCDVYV